jgi:TRAP-type C4-dicarboxylate transport system permease small subunit
MAVREETRVERLFAVLDKMLAAVLVVLLVMMVLCISGEILLNALVQPIASTWLESLQEGDAPEASTEGPAETDTGGAPPTDSPPPSRLKSSLKGLIGIVAKASSPVNTASQTLLVWVGILGSALAFRQRAHLGVDALVRVYPRKVRLVLDHVATLLVGVFSLLVLVVGGYLVAEKAFRGGWKMPGIEYLNRGWFYLVLILAGILTLVYCIDHFLHPVAAGDADPAAEEDAS